MSIELFSQAGVGSCPWWRAAQQCHIWPGLVGSPRRYAKNGLHYSTTRGTKDARYRAALEPNRASLTEVTKLLNESHAGLLSDGQAGRQRHAELQAEWEEAFKAFEKSTDEFSATVKQLHGDVEAHRLPKTE